MRRMLLLVWVLGCSGEVEKRIDCFDDEGEGVRKECVKCMDKLEKWEESGDERYLLEIALVEGLCMPLVEDGIWIESNKNRGYNCLGAREKAMSCVEDRFEKYEGEVGRYQLERIVEGECFEDMGFLNVVCYMSGGYMNCENVYTCVESF